MRSTMPRSDLYRSRTVRAALGLFTLASMLVLASGRAGAQDATGFFPGTTENANPAPLSEEAQALLRELLNFDPLQSTGVSPLAIIPPSPVNRLPTARVQMPSAPTLDWNRTDKSDGSTALSVKQPLATEWDAKVGADFGLPATPGTVYRPDRPLPFTRYQTSSAAWANVQVPGLASIDARVEPGYEQNKLGTTVSRSVPLGSNFSVTLQNRFSMTETLGNVAPELPMMTNAPIGGPSQVMSSDRMVKFNILSTGTSFGAGVTNSTAERSQNKILAEQKIFNSLNITTTLTDPGAPTASKSITAGFKWQW